MLLIDRLAEAHIEAARDRGEFDNLPGAGKPLAFDDDRLVPEALRAGYRLLRNAGYVPAEVAARREALTLEDLLRHAGSAAERDRIARRLLVLRMRLEAARGATPAAVWAEYGGVLAGDPPGDSAPDQ